MKKTITAVLLLALLVAIFWPGAWVNEKFDEATLAVSVYVSEHEILGIAVFMLFSAASAALSPLSSVPIVPFAVTAWGGFSVFLLLLFSWSMGAIFSYAVGKYGIHAFFGHLVPFKRVEEYRRRLPEDSQFFLVLLFRLALPSEVSGLVLGGLKYNFYKYMAATVLSEIPFAIIAVYLGGAIVLDDPVQFAVWTAIGAVFLAIIIPIFLITIKIKSIGSGRDKTK